MALLFSKAAEHQQSALSARYRYDRDSPLVHRQPASLPLRPDVIDRLADAGMATFNFAVDVVDEKPGLPKALAPIRRYFDYLVRKQYSYGYTVFFNINITRRNMDDVMQLTEIAREHGIATDCHMNESPMMEQPDFKHLDNNDTFLRPEDMPKFDEVIDWLVEKKRQGYKMVNSAARIRQMKQFARENLQEWNCRAGQNTLIIRKDGSLAPCFPMYNAKYDWGAVENPRFESEQLQQMKQSCQPNCFLDVEPHRWLLLQRHSRDSVAAEASVPSLPGSHKLRVRRV